jgi:hypothetical protein
MAIWPSVLVLGELNGSSSETALKLPEALPGWGTQAKHRDARWAAKFKTISFDSQEKISVAT